MWKVSIRTVLSGEIILELGNIARPAEFHILLEQNHKQKELECKAWSQRILHLLWCPRQTQLKQVTVRRKKVFDVTGRVLVWSKDVHFARASGLPVQPYRPAPYWEPRATRSVKFTTRRAGTFFIAF